MLPRHPVVPDGGFGTVFVFNFADVGLFGAIWISQAGAVARLVRVLGVVQGLRLVMAGVVQLTIRKVGVQLGTAPPKCQVHLCPHVPYLHPCAKFSKCSQSYTIQQIEAFPNLSTCSFI